MDINIPYEVLQNVETQLRSTASTLETELAQLGSTFDAMDWTGKAHQLYVGKKVQWQSAANNMQTVCNQMSTAVGTHHQNAVTTETTNQRSWA